MARNKRRDSEGFPTNTHTHTYMRKMRKERREKGICLFSFSVYDVTKNRRYALQMSFARHEAAVQSKKKKTPGAPKRTRLQLRIYCTRAHLQREPFFFFFLFASQKGTKKWAQICLMLFTCQKVAREFFYPRLLFSFVFFFPALIYVASKQLSSTSTRMVWRETFYPTCKESLANRREMRRKQTKIEDNPRRMKYTEARIVHAQTRIASGELSSR